MGHTDGGSEGDVRVRAEEIGGAKPALLANMKERASRPAEVSLAEPLSVVVGYFDENPRDFGVLVVEGSRALHLISRDWTAEQLSRPYFREIFYRRPLSELLALYGLPPLELPDQTDIPAAIEKALSRSPASRYQPIVVRSGDGSRWLLDVSSLLVRQCRLLASTLHELEEQRAATQTAEAQREQLQQRLVSASREAGRAEVATGVLHNVGNVLNSVNVSVAMIGKTLQQSKLGNLAKSVAIFEEHRHDLPSFLSNDERGRRLPGYLSKLANVLAEEQGAIVQEVQTLSRSLDHIRQVVQMQQSYAKDSTLLEPVRPMELMEDALRVNTVAFERHNVQITREYADIPTTSLDKHKVLQILINLVSNAKNAVKNRAPLDKRITLKIELSDSAGRPHIRFQVSDNGEGIAAENLTRIFTHGFTTRKEGHGFGLHSAANAAREMGGSLQAASEGTGRGAVFALELPLIDGAGAGIASESSVKERAAA